MDRDDDPCKLFIGGLTRSTTTEMLRQHFQQFGELTDCVVIKNPTTKLSRCFGFVQFTTPQIADRVVESRPHIIDGKEADVKHASAESHERHQQQLAAAAAATAAVHERSREPSPDKQKKRSRWEMQQHQTQSPDSHPGFSLPNDMITMKSNTHMVFMQPGMIMYPIPLKYLRENNFQQQFAPPSNNNPNDAPYFPSSRHQHNSYGFNSLSNSNNNNNNGFNNRMYPT